MSITVKLNPLLRRYVSDYDHDTGIVLADGSGKNVRQIVNEIAIPEERVTSVLVNHMPSRTGYVVKEGDLILLAMLIGGG
jgi:ribosome biogenesis protein Tsr3